MSRLRSLGARTWIALALAASLAVPVGTAAQDPAPGAGAPPLPVTVLRVQTPAYELDTQGLRVPGYGTNGIPGAPSLPVWSTVVELPTTGEPILTVDAGATRELSHQPALPAVPVPQPVEPSPSGFWLEDEVVVNSVDRPDPLIYKADAFYPAALVQAGEVGWQGGRRLLPVRVYPFQYNPVAGVLRYYPDIRVTVGVQDKEEGRRKKEEGKMDFASPAVEFGNRSWEAPHAAAAAELKHPERSAAKSKDGSRAAFIPLLSVNSSPASNGAAFRVYTSGRGMVGLSFADLAALDAGFAAADPATFAVSYLGQPVDIQVIDRDDDTEPDTVVFYAEPYVGRYDTRNVYWFTYGGTPSPAMTTRTVEPVEAPVATEIIQTVHVENNLDYRSLYPRARDADHWFDTNLYPNATTPTVTRSYTLALDDALTGDSRTVTLRAVVHGGTPQSAAPDQSMQILLNSHDVGLHQLGGSGLYQWEGSTDTFVEATLPASWLDASPNKVSLVTAVSQLPGLAYYWISPDWVELTYPAIADADGAGALYIEGTVAPASEVHVAGFTSADVRVYDIGDPLSPVELLGKEFDAGTGLFSFGGANIADPTYYLSTDDALRAPAAIELDAPSTWGTAAHTADYIAIVHDSLWGEIDPLLAHRADPAGDNFRVAKVDVQDIYDEFNYGQRDPEAIRSFLRYAYRYWNGGGGAEDPPAPPQYVLLVGSGTYDFTGAFTGATKPNLIPPYLADVDPGIGEAPADNRYVSVDDPVNGVEDVLAEMHIGRIPAQNGTQLAAAVDKILAYETTTPAGDWQRRAVYVADDCVVKTVGADFHQLSDTVRLGWLPDSYEDRTVYYGNPAVCPRSDASTFSGMLAGISAEFNQAALMVQWFGHGSRFRWGYSGTMFSNKDVVPDGAAPDLNANTAWPVTFHYSCWTGYFVNMHKLSSYNYMDQTLGEALLLTSQRGSVADLSPAGQHLTSSLLALNERMTQAIFQDAVDRVGAAVDAGKLAYWSQVGGDPELVDVIDTSVLFGDPATRLRLPPLVSAAAGGGSTVTLSWKHVSQYSGYQVRRSTRPYFAWNDGAPAGTLTGPFSAQVAIDDDEGAIGNVGVNYFYMVRGVNADAATADSNRVGEFDFALAPGG